MPVGRLRLQHVIFADGERFPMLIGKSGIPHAYPTLFITTQVRNAAKAPNTIAAVLSAIRSFLVWADLNNIDCERRFARREFLVDSEIESFLAFSQSKVINSKLPEVKKVVPLPRRTERARSTPVLSKAQVSAATHYIRLTYVAEYLEWYAKRLIGRGIRFIDTETLNQIKDMVNTILNRRPPKPSQNQTPKKGLTKEAQARLREIVRPNSQWNPFKPKMQGRNQLIVELLLALGNRAGELLALKVNDFDFQRNEVLVARRHGDIEDPRPKQPVLKTMDRLLPLTESLTNAVYNYVIEERRKFNKARRHSFLLVTHQEGPFQGMPLSQKGLTKIFNAIREQDPKLLGDLSPHLLRHTVRNNFSELMDDLQVSEAEEEKMSSYQFGWKEGSGTAAKYTRRHIEQRARAAFLKLQERNSRASKHNG